MSAENIMKAHKQLEAGSSIGKIVLIQMDSSEK
jgi:hypothetical protein